MPLQFEILNVAVSPKTNGFFEATIIGVAPFGVYVEYAL
jgi:hypothetical protein